ncbi:MAG: AbrB/MazE/SpoVT family DNA-binding domain-containing protein [Planctomycetaceae bacterium]
MQTRVQKWGNSLALRIPKPFALQLRLTEGQPVELALDEGRMTVEPSLAQSPSLEDLVARIRIDRTPRSWQ